jgi:hypothetical protein
MYMARQDQMATRWSGQRGEQLGEEENQLLSGEGDGEEDREQVAGEAERYGAGDTR